jgi:hypothetical protein
MKVLSRAGVLLLAKTGTLMLGSARDHRRRPPERHVRARVNGHTVAVGSPQMNPG